MILEFWHLNTVVTFFYLSTTLALVQRCDKDHFYCTNVDHGIGATRSPEYACNLNRHSLNERWEENWRLTGREDVRQDKLLRAEWHSEKRLHSRTEAPDNDSRLQQQDKQTSTASKRRQSERHPLAESRTTERTVARENSRELVGRENRIGEERHVNRDSVRRSAQELHGRESNNVEENQRTGRDDDYLTLRQEEKRNERDNWAESDRETMTREYIDRHVIKIDPNERSDTAFRDAENTRLRERSGERERTDRRVARGIRNDDRREELTTPREHGHDQPEKYQQRKNNEDREEREQYREVHMDREGRVRNKESAYRENHQHQEGRILHNDRVENSRRQNRGDREQRERYEQYEEVEKHRREENRNPEILMRQVGREDYVEWVNNREYIQHKQREDRENRERYEPSGIQRVVIGNCEINERRLIHENKREQREQQMQSGERRDYTEREHKHLEHFKENENRKIPEGSTVNEDRERLIPHMRGEDGANCKQENSETQQRDLREFREREDQTEFIQREQRNVRLHRVEDREELERYQERDLRRERQQRKEHENQEGHDRRDIHTQQRRSEYTQSRQHLTRGECEDNEDGQRRERNENRALHIREGQRKEPQRLEHTRGHGVDEIRVAYKEREERVQNGKDIEQEHNQRGTRVQHRDRAQGGERQDQEIYKQREYRRSREEVGLHIRERQRKEDQRLENNRDHDVDESRAVYKDLKGRIQNEINIERERDERKARVQHRDRAEVEKHQDHEIRKQREDHQSREKHAQREMRKLHNVREGRIQREESEDKKVVRLRARYGFRHENRDRLTVLPQRRDDQLREHSRAEETLLRQDKFITREERNPFEGRSRNNYIRNIFREHREEDPLLEQQTNPETQGSSQDRKEQNQLSLILRNSEERLVERSQKETNRRDFQNDERETRIDRHENGEQDVSMEYQVRRENKNSIQAREFKHTRKELNQFPVISRIYAEEPLNRQDEKRSRNKLQRHDFRIMQRTDRSRTARSEEYLPNRELLLERFEKFIDYTPSTLKNVRPHILTVIQGILLAFIAIRMFNVSNNKLRGNFLLKKGAEGGMWTNSLKAM